MVSDVEERRNGLDYHTPLVGRGGGPSARPVLARLGGRLLVAYLVSSYVWAAVMMVGDVGSPRLLVILAPVMAPLWLLGIVFEFQMDAQYVNATARELSVRFAAFPALFAGAYVVLYFVMRCIAGRDGGRTSGASPTGDPREKTRGPEGRD